jgi:uncharacterized membrane protein (UPF0127 family)
MKNIKFLLLLTLIALAFLASYFFIRNKYSLTQENISFLQLKKQTNEKILEINDETIYVEVADTEDKRRKGLSGRKSLKKNQGMLFDFKVEDTQPTFWMKDMNFDIDIVWINDGMISQIDSNVPAPAPNTSESQLTLYKPSSLIDYVLEIRAGYTDEKNIKVGDKVELPVL